jgi:signal transduction histidine kinase
VKPFDVTEVGLRIKNLLLTRYLYLQLQSQNQTLTELNDLKSRFVSMASHEFKTPLSSILMSGETLSAYWKRMSEDQINKKIRTIIEQVDHLTNIVNDVMQLSKLQTGNTVVKMTRLDLVVICKEIIGEFNSNPKNKRTLEDLPPGLPFHSLSNQGPIEFFTEFESLEMRLDQRLILQVLNNLLSNAIKYSEGQPWVRVSLYKQPDELVLCVKDQGMGIPEVDFKHLFQPFFRAENVSQIEGNGLGLNIVRESVRLLGGEVTFSSKVGEGSTFYIHLPDSLLFLPG